MKNHNLFIISIGILTVILILSAGCILSASSEQGNIENIAEVTPEVTPTSVPFDSLAYRSAVPDGPNKEIIENYYQNPTGYTIRTAKIWNWTISSRTYTGGDITIAVIVFSSENANHEEVIGKTDCTRYPGTDILKQTNEMKSDAMKNGFVWIYRETVFCKDPSISSGIITAVFNSSNYRFVTEHRLPVEEYEKLFS